MKTNTETWKIYRNIKRGSLPEEPPNQPTNQPTQPNQPTNKPTKPTTPIFHLVSRRAVAQPPRRRIEGHRAEAAQGRPALRKVVGVVGVGVAGLGIDSDNSSSCRTSAVIVAAALAAAAAADAVTVHEHKSVDAGFQGCDERRLGRGGGDEDDGSAMRGNGDGDIAQ